MRMTGNTTQSTREVEGSPGLQFNEIGDIPTSPQRGRSKHFSPVALVTRQRSSCGSHGCAAWPPWFVERNRVFSIILGSILVPATTLALPLYLMMSKVGLTNTIWAVLLPSLVTPFGVYLARIYAASSVLDELLEAARIDGANEFRTFRIALYLMTPALVTVLLFGFVGIWTNFFLPLVMFNDPSLFPVRYRYKIQLYLQLVMKAEQ